MEIAHSILMFEDAEWFVDITVPKYYEDEMKWVLEAFGKFSMKSIYNVRNIDYYDENCSPIWDLIWKSQIHYCLEVVFRGL